MEIYKILFVLFLTINHVFTEINTISTENMPISKNVFQDAKFWTHFKHQVELGSWKCNFPKKILEDTLEKDVKLYDDDTIIRTRRKYAIYWIENKTEWISLILEACKEIINKKTGPYSHQLKNAHMFDALDDFVQHLHYFYIIATEMASRGYKVKVFSQYSSNIHDIDKLDPVMLVGYSERFEDNKTTELWDRCVNRHTHVNFHHQAHSIWHKDDCIGKCSSSSFCNRYQEWALLEMICDKVSRRLQKNLHGHFSEDVWDVEEGYYDGLPKCWMNEVQQITKKLKETRRNSF